MHQFHKGDIVVQLFAEACHAQYVKYSGEALHAVPNTLTKIQEFFNVTFKSVKLSLPKLCCVRAFV